MSLGLPVLVLGQLLIPYGRAWRERVAYVERLDREIASRLSLVARELKPVGDQPIDLEQPDSVLSLLDRQRSALQPANSDTLSKLRFDGLLRELSLNARSFRPEIDSASLAMEQIRKLADTKRLAADLQLGRRRLGVIAGVLANCLARIDLARWGQPLRAAEMASGECRFPDNDFRRVPRVNEKRLSPHAGVPLIRP